MKGEILMEHPITNEKRAHDLALLFVKYQMDHDAANTNHTFDEFIIWDMYKSAFDNFLEEIENC